MWGSSAGDAVRLHHHPGANAGYLEADDGEVFGLHNLAAAAARAPE
ncbi:hypothetical protein [Janibacter hoylei]|nr:hypothetical protein [Janibacter hoylei]MCT1618913.1 hypothetical protein [Janibacter hoylei]MCT2292325.1 hypothetical protein [Janibacter hoylei]